MKNYFFGDAHWTGTSAQRFLTSTTTTWTMRLSHRPAYMVGGWLGFVDALGHKLNIPAKLMKPVCDHCDIAVGIPKGDLIKMDYTLKGKPVPWWLR